MIVRHYTEDQPEYQIALDAFHSNVPVVLPNVYSATPLYVTSITIELSDSKTGIEVELCQPYLDLGWIPPDV